MSIFVISNYSHVLARQVMTVIAIIPACPEESFFRAVMIFESPTNYFWGDLIPYHVVRRPNSAQDIKKCSGRSLSVQNDLDLISSPILWWMPPRRILDSRYVDR